MPQSFLHLLRGHSYTHLHGFIFSPASGLFAGFTSSSPPPALGTEQHSRLQASQMQIQHMRENSGFLQALFWGAVCNWLCSAHLNLLTLGACSSWALQCTPDCLLQQLLPRPGCSSAPLKFISFQGNLQQCFPLSATTPALGEKGHFYLPAPTLCMPSSVGIPQEFLWKELNRAAVLSCQSQLLSEAQI